MEGAGIGRLLGVLFNDIDIEEIANIVTLQQVREDKYVWKFNNKGMYMVKSAYRYAT